MSLIYIYICTKTTADPALPTSTFSQIDYNRRVSNSFRALAGGRLVVGDLKLRPTATAVLNHLLCDGTAIGRTSYPELFNLLGDDFGAGDGLTTFNLPDYRGAPVEAAAITPAQTVTESTASTGEPVVAPVDPGETGGTTGGDTISGGTTHKLTSI